MFPHIEECAGPLTEKQKQLARAFVIKAYYNWDETRDLIEALHSTPNLRLLCGYDSVSEVPSEATFSWAFAEFAASELAGPVSGRLKEEYGSAKVRERGYAIVFMHIIFGIWR